MTHYDLIAIGAGTAGLTVTRLVAGPGKRVALVERAEPGGDCLHTGCVPTKTLLHAAGLLHAAKTGAAFGVIASDVRLDYAAVKQQVAEAKRRAGEIETPEAIAANGVELLRGDASFVDAHTLDIDGARVTADTIVIATGSEPAVPPIPGLVEAGYETNVELLDWEELPRSLGVIGGGPIGMEFAQMMTRFGVETTVVEFLPQLLGREEADAAAIVRTATEREGLTVHTGAGVTRVEATARGRQVFFEQDGAERSFECERLLVATGRRPELEGLNLEPAGVTYDGKGITVDKQLRTAQKNIFVAGDAAGGYQFTHVAEAQGRLVANIVNGKRFQSWSDRVVPRVTFTDPEVASVGLTVAEARKQHRGVRVLEVPLTKVDRAITMGATEGFIRIVTARGWQRWVPGLRKAAGDEIVGACMVGPNAGDLLMPVVMAMRARLPVGLVAWNMQAYPTMALGVRQAAGLPFD